jgi:hypothetical protein
LPANWQKKITALLNIVKLPRSEMEDMLSIAASRNKVNSLSYIAGIIKQRGNKIGTSKMGKIKAK